MIILKKIMGIILFFGILSITVFYVFNLMAEPFDSRNAEEIILKQAEDSGKTVSIKDRHNIDVLLDTFNKGKRMKEKTAHNLPAPAYHGYISMTDTHRVHFTIWLKKDEAVILKEEEGTYFVLRQREKDSLLRELQKRDAAGVPFSVHQDWFVRMSFKARLKILPVEFFGISSMKTIADGRLYLARCFLQCDKTSSSLSVLFFGTT